MVTVQLPLETEPETIASEVKDDPATVTDVMELVRNHKPDAILAAARLLSELPPPLRQEGKLTVVMGDEERARILLSRFTLRN